MQKAPELEAHSALEEPLGARQEAPLAHSQAQAQPALLIRFAAQKVCQDRS